MPSIRRPRPWSLPESAAAPESVFLSRRALIKGGAGALGVIAAGPASAQWLDLSRNRVRAPQQPDPTADLYPRPRNEAYTLDRPITPEETTTTVVNYYEFSSDKKTAGRLAQNKTIRPWTVRIDGLVEEEKTVDVDTLIRSFGLEERTYRHRCVEAWSIAVPWTGFPMAKFLEFARPQSDARYVRFETFSAETLPAATGWAPGLRQSWYPWPYNDAFTLAECANELAFLVTGAYGKPLDRANGNPLRIVTPWKYGFKQPKGITRISFLDKRPKGYWEVVQGREYGFWANVNPEVPHPRWSQASERDLHTGEVRPTQLFNGYGRYVADLYKDLAGEKLFM